MPELLFAADFFGFLRIDFGMRREIAGHVFDDQDLVSIQDHADLLKGFSLADIAERLGNLRLLKGKGKGIAGQLIQTWFGIDPNDGRPEPDLPDVRTDDGRLVGVEVKVVPLLTRPKGVKVKERCKVTSIEYRQLLEEVWDGSRAKHKLVAVLFIFYRYASPFDWAKSAVDRSIVWLLDRSASREVIHADWQRTWDMVADGRAHELSESQALILGASTAGAGGDSKHVAQPNGPTMARKRAFSLKPSFLQTTYEAAVQPKKFASVMTLRGQALDGGLHDSIIRGLRRFDGKTLAEIALELGLPREESKKAAASMLRRALGVSTGKQRLLELEEAGVKPKTVPVRSSDLWPLEAMSFPVMRLKEFAEEEAWEESDLRTHLECLLILPVMADRKDQEKWQRRLAHPFFWSPSPAEEEGIAAEWDDFQRQVRNGKAAYTRIGGRRVAQLRPSSETSFIHLRPKGPDGSVDDVDPEGNATQQLCFWLNQKFVQSILARNLR